MLVQEDAGAPGGQLRLLEMRTVIRVRGRATSYTLTVAKGSLRSARTGLARYRALAGHDSPAQPDSRPTTGMVD